MIGEWWQTVAATAIVFGVTAGARPAGSVTGVANPELWRVLGSPGPRPEAAAKTSLYDRLIGNWELEVVDHDPGGPPRTSRGEWYFGWVLEGRAIQDVFVAPRLDERGERSGPVAAGNRYGTTIRTYEPASDRWRIRWTNPVSGAFSTLVGRAEGDDIVQEGRDDSGARIRWNFSRITVSSFHWTGEISNDDGATWRLQVEFHARRKP